MSGSEHLAAIGAYVDAHADAMLEEWKTLVRQPSISAQNVGVRECAAIVAEMMRADGIDTQIMETGGQPVIIGKGEAVPGAPTILVYGHYDVQPVGFHRSTPGTARLFERPSVTGGSMDAAPVRTKASSSRNC